MEISDETTPVAEQESAFERDVRTVFQDTLGLIHIALVAHYGLVDSEANELEKDLYLWFVRFCMRPGSKPPKESRSFLLVACCQFAREYQRYLIGTGERPASDRITHLLQRDPSDVAHDFGQSLDLLRFRHNPDA
ncbi:MAG: hypothetical protein M3R62_07530 [Acidobacteriota bacterium]|nr:hypothetical protein [Acidobacteriota bacterium]